MRDQMRLSNLFLFAITLMWLTFISGAGYLLFIDGTVVNKPIIYWDGSFVTLDGPYVPGQEVPIRVIATKYTDEVGRVYWTLVNNRTGHLDHFESLTLSRSRGYLDVIVEISTIPINTPPGTYHLEGIIKYPVNQLRTVAIPVRSSDFEVIEPSKRGDD